MALFNIGKPKAPAPAPVQKSAPAPAANLNADDFFKDIDNRKRRPKKVDDTIEVPEVTGLREAPPPPPKSTLRNMDTPDTDGLRDKIADPDVFVRGDIVGAGESSLDTGILPDKTEDVTPWSEEKEEQRRAKKVLDPTSADDFFSDIDRRKNRRGRVNPNIDVPEVTGLREGPAAPAVIRIAGTAENIDTEGLRDKTLHPDEFVRGDINVIDTERLSTDSLRGEQE